MIKTEDFLYNTGLDKMTIQEMKVGKECYVNGRHNHYFGTIQNFTSVGDGQIGLVIYDKKGERHEVHHDWIYHHPAIIDRTDEFYTFAGEVILINWGLKKEESAVCIFCMVNPSLFKLINIGNIISSFPNRIYDAEFTGKYKAGKFTQWISKKDLIEATRERFHDIELTGKTIEEYYSSL